MRILLLALAFLVPAFAPAAEEGGLVAPWRAGQHYGELPVGVTHGEDGVVVTEFFSYACIHCFNFEPELERWAEEQPGDVVFERVHIVANRFTQLLAAAYAAADACDVLETTHTPFFRALHLERRRFTSMEQIADFYVETLDEAGVESDCADRDKLLATFESFGVRSMVSNFQSRSNTYLAGRDSAGVTGTPAMIVDGRWYTQGSMAGTNEAMLEVVDHLVRRARTAVEAGGGETAGP